ncbi:Bug family tripartite tricarboxylate transporter substrate binding protein [Roseomonas populi]|uniref:Tripartite tricarboxylate transporter substrate binding protein n=1 Tax=Roseomonas populi TaxID=3121582 RepID=A0ABT1WZA7_9PROT|nr:tripartite tricarboxylate transporter substrate binding protein [Roseomonas pecuniae]MCR0981178.1 tripartite tricarboxylate transporter substrate binding protein [Roseomonas pecuniae]
MNTTRRTMMRRLALALGLILPLSAQAADPWPQRTIRVVVPYPPGGPADIMGRLAAQKLGERLGVNTVVENRSGASGTVGAEAVRAAAPDGYTLLAAPSVHVMGRQVLRSVPYDPVGDFTPIARLGQGPLLVLANPSVPGRTIAEMLPALRAQPSNFSFGLSAFGAANHLAVLDFNRRAGLDLLIVPYRGSGPALTDLIAGQLQLMIDPMSAALPHVQDGRLKALAVTSARRSPIAPEIPTVAESGMPGLEFASWYGVWGPRGLPAEIVQRVNAALVAGMRDPNVVERLAALGNEPVTETPEEFAAFIEADVRRNTEILRTARYQPE